MRTGMEWDPWFLELCDVVSKKSQCLSRKIGSVLVRDNSVISTGYNGPPRGVMTCDDRWFYDEEMRKKAGFDKLTGLELVQIHETKLEGVCPRYTFEMGFKSGEGLDLCVAGHSEENALLNAARHGIETKGTKLYMNCGIPCKNCLIKIINCGVEEIIVTGYNFYDNSSEYLLKQSGLSYRVYDHLDIG